MLKNVYPEQPGWVSQATLFLRVPSSNYDKVCPPDPILDAIVHLLVGFGSCCVLNPKPLNPKPLNP